MVRGGSFENEAFVKQIISQAAELKDVRADILKTIHELSLIYEASHLCRTPEELLKFVEGVENDTKI